MNSKESLSPSLSRRQLLVASGLAVFSGMISACSQTESNKKNELPAPSHNSGPNAADLLSYSPFMGTAVDSAIWSYDTDPLTPTYNQEAQKYTDNHARIRKHRLVIDAVIAAGGYESSRIHTKGKFNFTYGTLTARAKLPAGIGTHPAIWLMPEDGATPAVLQKHDLPDDTDNPYYYVYGGEIDFLETVGAQADPVNNQPAVHTYNSRVNGPTGMSTTTVPVPDGQQAFHDYGLHKEPGLLEFTLDGSVVHRVTRNKGDSLQDWPFEDYRYYVIANLAMGGSWGGERRDEFPPQGIDDSKAPWEFEISRLHYQPL